MAHVRPAVLAITLCLAVVGCGKPAQPGGPPQGPAPAADVKPTPPTPIAEKKQQLGDDATWNPQWDTFVEKSVPPELLSAQAARAVHSYCPAFGGLPDADKRAFWAYTFQALAGAEAGLEPDTVAHHTAAAVNKKDAVTKRPIHQEGLLQLTYEDAQRYGCSFDDAHDRALPEKDPRRSILQPEQNLACGLKIMQNQIATQGEPLISRKSYWSTLQPGTRSFRVFAKQMANVPPVCKAAGK